jgi:hypothetical protein
MSVEDYTKDRLWPILVETAHALVMYIHHKTYVEEFILHDKTDVNANELAARLGITLGEALVILQELREQIGSSTAAVEEWKDDYSTT